MVTYEEVEKILAKTAEVPFPEVTRVIPNERYATMLYDDFAGDLGELSAITQYIYEHIQLNDQPDLAKIMKRIAIEEMKHLDIVGDIIKRSGKKAIYQDAKGILWSAKNVKYEFKGIKEIMDFNIYSENKAIEGYRKAIMYTNQMSLKRLWERIIVDEKTHKMIFERIKQESKS